MGDHRTAKVLLHALGEELQIGLINKAEYTRRAKEILEDCGVTQVNEMEEASG